MVAADAAQPADAAAHVRALAIVAALVAFVGGVVVLLTHPGMVDLEIPLRAADRWAHGGEPYLAASFAAPEGYDLPFLYPPPVLPFLAALLHAPRPLVDAAWIATTVGAAVFVARRLGVPWAGVPIALCWVPFSEGLVGGNVQVLLVAAYVAVFFGPPATKWQPSARDLGDGRHPAILDGTLAALAPALKLAQPHAWAALLRWRPFSALLGLAAVVAVALATLPLVGIDAWQAWLAQLERAADPAWPLRGSSLVQLLPGLLSPAATGLTVIVAMLLPSRRVGAAAGLLLVLGAPSLRSFGALFMLPAVLAIRRDVALVAVILVGTGVMAGLWAAVLLVTIAFVAGERLDRGIERIAARWTRRPAGA